MRYTTQVLSLVSIFLAAPLSAATSPDGNDACQYIPGPHDAGVVEATGNGVSMAWYGSATEIYGHAVLGDGIEAHTLYVRTDSMAADDCAIGITLDDDSVFEDVTPRIADVTGDGVNNIITIESHQNQGASLAIYGVSDGKLSKQVSTPYIGQSYRWLAPVGVADFNSDGSPDVAIIVTPHLAGVLQIWSFKDDAPQRLASQPGFSNHRIGENFITGGVAQCNGKDVMVVPDRTWRSTMTVTFSNGELQAVQTADDVTSATIEQQLACQ